MHQFICIVQEGKIVPLEHSKKKFFNKLINSYSDLNKKFKVTIENIEKNINESQISLYRAFIIKSSEHFGVSYNEMQKMLMVYWPLDLSSSVLEVKYKDVDKWSNEDLDLFITKASSHLGEYGFKFE